MHPNPIFRQMPDADSQAFAREQGFGMLAISGPVAPMLSHIPFLLSEDGTEAEFHLVRSNPIARALKDEWRPARLAVQGPHSYISPDWYGLDDQVPTWNYVAVHLTGTVELQPQKNLHDLLDRQSALFEHRLAPKTPWTTAKMTKELLHKMMRQIVPCRMRVEALDGTWKLGQNKPEAVRLAAADHVFDYGIGQEVPAIAGLMRGVRPE